MRKRLKKKLRGKTFRKAADIGFMLNQYDDALVLVNHFLRGNPKDTLALSMKGNLLDMQPLWDATLPRPTLNEEEAEVCHEEALRCYQGILSLDPKDAEAMRDIGDYWERKENHAEALRWYDRAIATYREERGKRVFRDPLEDIVEERERILKTLQEGANGKPN